MQALLFIKILFYFVVGHIIEVRFRLFRNATFFRRFNFQLYGFRRLFCNFKSKEPMLALLAYPSTADGILMGPTILNLRRTFTFNTSHLSLPYNIRLYTIYKRNTGHGRGP